MVESNLSILILAFWESIPTSMSQTGNILGVSEWFEKTDKSVTLSKKKSQVISYFVFFQLSVVCVYPKTDLC